MLALILPAILLEMSSYIRITRQPYEEPAYLNLVIEASNGKATGRLEYYDHASSFTEMADELEAFPRNGTHTYVHEVGSESSDDRYAFYFLLRVVLTNSRGHCAVHLRFNNNEDIPGRQISELCIPAMPADINRLGNLLREFAKLEKSVLEWNVCDGEVR